MGRPQRLLNRSFLLLWQGQLVSALGDAVYRIALGFWVLAATGSTAVMGALMAASVVPRVLLSPLCGAVTDRADRKWLLVLADGASGLAVVAVGAAALADTLEVWMVFAAAVVLGAATALFQPTVESAVADIVPASKLTQANGALSLLATGAAVLGNAIGGFVYQALGAALVFVLNGSTFLLSAASELFIRIPRHRSGTVAVPLHRDLRAGLGLVWRDRALRAVYGLTGAHNLFSTATFVLLLALFEQTAALGATSYGLVMAGLALGAFGGFAASSALPLAPRRRVALFIVLGWLEACCLGALPWAGLVPWMVALAAVAGFATSVHNTILTTALQLAVPAHLRGRAFGLRASWMMSLAGLGMVGGGALAEILPAAVLITGAAVGMALAVLGLAAALPVRRLIACDRTR